MSFGENREIKKILLIEDNKKISENIKSYLELDNFNIEIAYLRDT